MDGEVVASLEVMKDASGKLSRALISLKAEGLLEELDEIMEMADAVGELQDGAWDAEDAIDAVSTKVYRIIRNRKRLCPGKDFLRFNAFCHKIKDIAARIDSISQATQTLRFEWAGRLKIPCPRPLYLTGFVVSQDDVVGREDDVRKILDMLLAHDSDQFSVIPIVGMAGLGKTTLAQVIFNRYEAVQHFDLRIWVSVTVDFNYPRILEDIITSITHTNGDLAGLSMSIIEPRAVGLLAGKRFLLVLDDVWPVNYFQWEPLEKVLRHGERGSRVLVTSRTVKASDIMGALDPYRLGFLPNHDCWGLFRSIAFKGSNRKLSDRTMEDLENIGMKIVAKCGGLPLAVKAMAGLLCGNTDVNKWQKISNNDMMICKAEKQNLLPALRLSYHYLPSRIKQCFAYCSLFPKAYVFDKKDLIKLWMAEGFIQSMEQEEIPEETGSQYFVDLLMRSFFQPASEQGTDKYTMHDLIHELAQLVSSPYSLQVKNSEQLQHCSLSHKTRHVSLLGKDVEQPITQIVHKSKQLRMLVLFPSKHPKNIRNTLLDKTFQTLTHLRVLDLSSSTISVLPESIEKLQLLRYLDLSKTEITRLPDSICNLYNLQTLKLLECFLSQLPKHFAKLINLRHLELDQSFWYTCTKLPPRMGSLTSLHNLHAFPIGCKKGYGIEELKHMNFLTGALHVSKLENAAVPNAAEAKLEEKEDLEKLILEWSSTDEDVAAGSHDEVMVLQHLRPHSNLQELRICRFRGTRFPLWMTDGLQLQNLLTLSLNDCSNCKILTLGLGHLPRLQKLCLKGMQELQELTAQCKEMSLEKLKIVNCSNLTKILPSFPKLRKLKIKSCNSLKALPVTKSLMSLALTDNLVLQDWNEVNSSFSELLELKVDFCPRLQALPQVFAPQKLEINGCELVRELPNRECFQNLQHLAVDQACKGGKLVGAIPGNSPLCSLVISNISNATSFPKWPSLPRLKALHIRHCKDLVSLCEEPSAFQGLTFLKLLSIQCCPKLMTLTHDGLPETLECFTISRCTSLESLGPKDVLKSLTSLSDLYIEDCPKLLCFPEEGVYPSLQHLVIQGCPLLAERCRRSGKEGGPDWPKIMRVPDLEVESTNVCLTPDLPKPKPSSAHWYSNLSCCRG